MSWTDIADWNPDRGTRIGIGRDVDERALALYLPAETPEERRRDATAVMSLLASWVERRHPCAGVGRCQHPDHADHVDQAAEIADMLGTLAVLADTRTGTGGRPCVK